MWSSGNEGSSFWLNVATELENRGLNDILICCVDGLSGFGPGPALEAVFPQCQTQRCIHQLRISLKFVSWKVRGTIAAELKTIYTAPIVEAAKLALEAFRVCEGLERGQWQAGDCPGKGSGLRSRGVEPKRSGGEPPFPPHSKFRRFLYQVTFTPRMPLRPGSFWPDPWLR